MYFKNNEKECPSKNPAVFRRDLNRYFKFALVRNPYDRLVSCYFDKIVNLRIDEGERGIYKGFWRYNKFYPQMPFDEFMKVVYSTKEKIVDNHLKSQ